MALMNLDLKSLAYCHGIDRTFIFTAVVLRRSLRSAVRFVVVF